MMGMMGAMMLLMVLGALFFLVVLAGVIWLLMRWLTQRQTPPMPGTPQPQYPYQRYKQGYQPPQPMPESYQEGERHDRYPQPKQEYDQPHVPYPQEIPPQS